MVKPGDYIRLDNDMFEDWGVDYYVRSVFYRDNTTAVDLVLERGDDIVVTKTVASHQIIKV